LCLPFLSVFLSLSFFYLIFIFYIFRYFSQFITLVSLKCYVFSFFLSGRLNFFI
jgi:hypothetical protein